MSQNAYKTTRVKLWHKVIIAMILGVLLGHLAPEFGKMLKPLGTMYVNMIKMLVIPLVFFSIVNGISTVGDLETFNRLGKRALKIYIFSTTIAISIGIVLANVLQPGIGINLGTLQNTSTTVTAITSGGNVIDVIVNLIPSNVFLSMSSGNVIQIVFFAIFCGISLLSIGRKGAIILDFTTSIMHLIFKMVAIVISLTPYGVFGLMADAIATQGLSIILALAKFICTVLCGLSIQWVISGLFIFFIGKLNPLHFYKKMLPVYALAAATSSSKATLTTAMEVLEKKLGVSTKSTSFILPLGTTVNMDASAIYLGISTVFFSQIFGIDLSFNQYILIIFTATIGAMGSAGIPSGGVMMLGVMLSTVGIPLDGIAFIIGIDRFIDMIRTVININGDCAATVIVDKLEGTLDSSVYCKEYSKD